MKRILSLCILAALMACSPEEEPDIQRTDEFLFDALVSSRWKVTLFEDDGVVETKNFDGISFTFIPNGQVEAYRGTQLLDVGSWRSYTEDGRVEFELEFENDPILEELSDTWYQDRMTNGRLSLREESDGSEDRLNFETL